MTTEAIESLTDHTTGSPNPENSAPPQTIIPTRTDAGAEGIIRTDLYAAEERRQTVQAEAMVNLAVGVALMSFGALADPRGNRIGGYIKVTPDDLAEFQRDYTVTQTVSDDGGFTITVTPKEG